jgi:hypothetical protein
MKKMQLQHSREYACTGLETERCSLIQVFATVPGKEGTLRQRSRWFRRCTKRSAAGAPEIRLETERHHRVVVRQTLNVV